MPLHLHAKEKPSISVLASCCFPKARLHRLKKGKYKGKEQRVSLCRRILNLCRKQRARKQKLTVLKLKILSTPLDRGNQVTATLLLSASIEDRSLLLELHLGRVRKCSTLLNSPAYISVKMFENVCACVCVCVCVCACVYVYVFVSVQGVRCHLQKET